MNALLLLALLTVGGGRSRHCVVGPTAYHVPDVRQMIQEGDTVRFVHANTIGRGGLAVAWVRAGNEARVTEIRGQWVGLWIGNVGGWVRRSVVERVEGR